MPSAIVLPGSPTLLPEQVSQPLNIADSDNINVLATALSVFKALKDSHLNAADLQELSVEYLVGSTQTPSIWWFAAHLEFPTARLLFQQGDDSWLDLAWAELTPANLQPVTKPVMEAVEAPEPVAIKPTPTAPAVATEDTSKWAWNVYLAFIWELPDAERQYDDVLFKAQALTATHPRLVEEINTYAKQGRHAATMTVALNKKIQNGESEQEINSWIAKQAESQSPRIVKHLQVTFDKNIKYKKDKQQQHKKNTGFDITLPQVELENGIHPQSLRALKPAQEWDIYIDETGSNFSLSAENLNETDSNLGRIVALALPAGHKLAPLKQATHGVDLTHAKIETLLKAITSNSCGVLGASLKQDLRNTSWMSAINQLTHWLLLMLPVNGLTKVRVHIENRAPYNDSAYLKALQETLENDLKMLLPKRFENLHLSLEIMGKDNPYNGYVDAIANCWGSNDAVKRKMLARTAWRGACLLQTTNLDRVENLYSSIATGAEITSKDWFDLCAASTQEPEHSLFHDMLEQLGEQAKANPKLWSAYLQEVRQRLTTKNFINQHLTSALAWLDTYKDEDYTLPDIMQLQLLSSDLTANNHQGFTQLEQVNQVLTLVNALEDEDAPEACQAVLRVVVRATHHYDFDSAQTLVEQWLATPVAVPGLLNHAKLHSTLGQLYAFKGQPVEAIASFDDAITAFERLSDKEAARKDIAQTNLYKAIALLDADDEKAADIVFNLVHETTTKADEAGIERLARSENPYRFTHYLLLRLLVSQPQWAAEREAYLSQEAEWKTEDSHPWMLINAYRAWLLQADKQTNLAVHYMQLAVESCFEAKGEMLNWMGHCLLALSKSLELKFATNEQVKAPASYYPEQSLGELEAATTDTQRLAALAKLLPFNFH